MSDNVPDLDQFDTDDADLPEIITLRPGEEPEIEESGEDDDKVTLSKDEFEALRRGTDSNSALLEGFKGLQEALKKPDSAPVNLQQKPGETEEEFETRLEKELFDQGKTGKAIKEAIQRYGGGQVSQLVGIINQQNRQLLEIHPEKSPVFKKYKDEIEGFVKALPVDQQNHPQVWDYAYEQVKNRHIEDLTQEKLNAQIESRIDEMVNERLKAMGIDPEKPKARSVQQSSTYASGKGSANVRSSGARRKVYVSSEDEANAAASGVPVEQYLRKIGKL